MPAFRLAIYDFDGTLADSADWFFAIMNEVARRYGFREITPAEREHLRGRPNREVVRALGIPFWKLPLIAGHMRRVGAERAGEIAPFPWLPAHLARVSAAGITVVIASSNRPDTIRRILGPDATAHVAEIVGGASLFGKAATFRTLVRRHGIDPAAAVAIGDEERDITAAREAGIAGVGVAWGLARREALEAARPVALVDDVEALEAVLLRDAAERSLAGG